MGWHMIIIPFLCPLYIHHLSQFRYAKLRFSSFAVVNDGIVCQQSGFGIQVQAISIDQIDVFRQFVGDFRCIAFLEGVQQIPLCGDYFQGVCVQYYIFSPVKFSIRNIADSFGISAFL